MERVCGWDVVFVCVGAVVGDATDVADDAGCEPDGAAEETGAPAESELLVDVVGAVDGTLATDAVCCDGCGAG